MLIKGKYNKMWSNKIYSNLLNKSEIKSMYIGYLNDRKQLGFSCIKDLKAGKSISNLKNVLKRTKGTSATFIVKKGKKITILIFSKEVLVGILIFLNAISMSIDSGIYYPSYNGYQSCINRYIYNNPKLNENFRHYSPMLDYILMLKGGENKLTEKDQQKLINSILSKTQESDLNEISLNKRFQRVRENAYPVIVKCIEKLLSDQRILKILRELQKPISSKLAGMPKLKSTDILHSRNFVKDNSQDNKILENLSSIFVEAFENPNPSTLSPMQKRVELNRQLAQERKKIPVFTPTMLQANQLPTAEMFTADPISGIIQDSTIAFEQFRARMIEIGNHYTDIIKQKYFLKLLDECSINRFEALSTEMGRFTIYGVREAETMLQSEFDGYHEPNSITRMTEAESVTGNKLDGRFRIGLLSGERDTLNKEFTDMDAKVLVSDKTLKHQADERLRLGHRNPNPISMYEQGQITGSSIIIQKSKPL